MHVVRYYKRREFITSRLQHQTINQYRQCLLDNCLLHTPWSRAFGIQTNSSIAKRDSSCLRQVVKLISGSWGRWWPNPHGGTSCLWTCPCSPGEPSSCLYQSLEPVTRGMDVSGRSNTRQDKETVHLTGGIMCHIPRSTSPWHSQEPCCNDDQMPSRDQATSCCSGSW